MNRVIKRSKPILTLPKDRPQTVRLTEIQAKMLLKQEKLKKKQLDKNE
jgi:hypothetical protein